jgi:hypothetical protein
MRASRRLRRVAATLIPNGICGNCRLKAQAQLRPMDIVTGLAGIDEQPKVRLGRTGGGSISPAVFAFVERGAMLRPQQARELRGSVLLRFSDDYDAVEVDLRGDEILVSDAHDVDRAHDLVLEGSFHDFAALIAAPLTGGLPRPTSSLGRAALARLADGRIEFEGPLRLARGLLRLLSALPDKRLPREGRRAPAKHPAHR